MSSWRALGRNSASGWPDVVALAERLDSEVAASGQARPWTDSPLRKEAVHRLCKIVAKQGSARRKLVTMAVMREAIPATSYADHHVRRFDRYAEHGRIFTFALHHAWLDETLHTKFVFVVASRLRRRLVRRAGAAFGQLAAYMHGAPIGVVPRVVEAVIGAVALIPGMQGHALRALRRVDAREYFAASADFEYAAALGWRVIDEIDIRLQDVARGGFIDPTVSLNAHELTVWNEASGITVADVARCAADITTAEIHHARTFASCAGSIATPRHDRPLLRRSPDDVSFELDAAGLAAQLNDVNQAYVPPEYRNDVRLRQSPEALEAERLDDLVSHLPKCKPRGHVCVIGDSDDSDDLRKVVRWLAEHQHVERVTLLSSIRADYGDRVEVVVWPSDDVPQEVHRHESGCVFLRWPKVWNEASMRVSVASVDHRNNDPKTFTSSLAALARLCTGVPRELQRRELGRIRRAIQALEANAQTAISSAVRSPPSVADVTVHALMLFLERYPPELSIVYLRDHDRIRLFGGANPIRVDERVTDEMRRKPTLALQQASRWFRAPVSPAADLSLANGRRDTAGEPQYPHERGGPGTGGDDRSAQPDHAPRP
jgi:hypothetical protein